MAKSVMQKDFATVPQVHRARSTFNRDHRWSGTLDAGYLVPVLVDEILPGDTLRCRVSSVGRLLSPLKYPIIDNLHIDWFFFAVPNRLLWQNWEKFQGAQDNPGDSTDYTIPKVTSFSPAALSLWDAMGLPPGVSQSPNALMSRAYNLVVNKWFKSQDLQDDLVVDTDDGPDDNTDYVLVKRGKRHDYFTSCLPWPQKGDEVTVPLGDVAPVLGIGKLDGTWQTGSKTVYETQMSGATASQNWNRFQEISGGGTLAAKEFYIEADPTYNRPSILADLSQASAASINEWREAFQMQRMLELDARSGTRYVEALRARFGVTCPDFRAQRPEYLGGGSTMLGVQTVVQQSETGTTPQGTLTAHGIHAQSGVGFDHSFVEHCVLIGLVNIRADLTYQQGIDKMWTRQTREELYEPVLAMLGEQAVLNKEIYADGSANDDLVFGYQERWAEYRYKTSHVTGALRSSYATSLDHMHLSQEFGALPVLNAAFIVDDPPIDRVLAVTSQPDFFLDCYFDYKHTRVMPVDSVPGMIDHF